MKLFSYIVARDYGFAPNPFFGTLTLATCKPKIRAKAAVGDWIIGTGAKGKYRLAGHLIYATKVEELLTFDGYWTDPRFACKRPVLNGSLKQVYGDNIYHRRGKRWLQADSHHSLEDGSPNPRNITLDTSANRVLVSSTFAYFGEAAVPIPKRFQPYAKTRENLCCTTQGHRIPSDDLAIAFVKWLEELGRWGLQGMPLEFARHKKGDAAASDRQRRRQSRRQEGGNDKRQ